MTGLDVVYTTLWQRNDLFVELADNGKVAIWRGTGSSRSQWTKYEAWWVRETLAGLGGVPPMTSVDNDAVPAVEAEMTGCECGESVHEMYGCITVHDRQSVPAPETVEAQEQAAAQVEFDALTKSREPSGAYSDFYYKRSAVEANLRVGLKPTGRLRALQALIEYEGAIRAPLEERIRALQTTNYRCEEMCEAAQYGGSCRCSHLFNELPAAEEQIQKLEDSLRYMLSVCEAEAYHLLATSSTRKRI